MYINESKVLKLLNQDIDILTLISDRGGRKSSILQNILIKDALKGHPFILIRSKSDIDISENWLSEYIRKKYTDITFLTRKLTRNINSIIMIKNNKEYVFCYTMYLSLAEKYKSNYFEGFEKVKIILWEECIPNAPIIQSVQYIRQRMLDDLINLMSIYSTVCRNHHAQIIMLGNDIKTNLLNPVTVCFNLLERLNINEVIDDYVTIDDRQYHYNFLYFDFEGAVNHWFVNDELDINNTIDLPEGIKAFDIICYSEFKKYYIYNMKKYIYITEKSVNKEFSFITSAREFFRSYNTEHLIDSYQLPLALQMLHYSGIADSSDIAYYFGDTWYINPVFRKPAKLHTNAVINLPELLKMKYNDLLNSALYPKLKQISELVTDNTVIYSNAQIKLLINELANKINIICD